MFLRWTADKWSQLLYRLNGAKEQCNLLCLAGPHTESKGTESPFYSVPVHLHFDYGGQPAHCSDYNSQ